MVEYETTLVKGQQYVVYNSQGQADTAVFPLVTEETALHNILPYLYPKMGQQLVPGNNPETSVFFFYNQYKSEDSIVEQRVRSIPGGIAPFDEGGEMFPEAGP